MPSAEITSYTAHTGHLGRLGVEKFIVLRHKMRAADTDSAPIEATSEIYFADRFGDSSSGFSATGGSDSVRGHLPASEFAYWLDLLRHEDPIYLHWSLAAEAGVPDDDGLLHLSTGPEPPGEGPIDLSP